ncbi:MAG: winged helix DNA-binding domain-containing protein [Candidatus Eiseniibacteriota bacterium]
MSARPIELSAAEALDLRLAGQRLDRRVPAKTLLEVVSAIGGAQAQVASAARLSLAARVTGVTDGVIERALIEDRTLVKTWTMRGTLHLVPARDLPFYAAVGGLLRIRYLDAWLARGGLNVRQAEEVGDDIVEALADGPLTRRGIAERVGDRHGKKARSWIEHSWGGIIRRPVYQGRVCFGPTRGTEVTFVRTDQWLAPGAAAMPVETVEAELARRYLGAYGPATVRDFAYWAGFYAPEARRMWERIVGEMTEVSVEGSRAFVLAAAVEGRRSGRGRRKPRAASAPHVRLLPHFDVYLLGHRAKDSVLAPAHYKKVFRTAGWVSPVVLVNGAIAGTWESERTEDELRIRFKPFRAFDRDTRTALEAEAEVLASSLGRRARLRRA